MAYYLIRARLVPDLAQELRGRLDRGDFRDMEPFGETLHKSLLGAHLDPETNEAVWEEEDYCSPPLAQERKAVLDRYFTDLRVETVEKGTGWEKIQSYPGLWSSLPMGPGTGGKAA